MQHTRYFAQQAPEKVAYIMAKTGEVVTRGELEERVNQCSQYFRDIGLRFGDRIAILMENNVHYLVITIAAQVAGLQYAAISTHFKLAEVEYIINDSEAKLLITSAQLGQIAHDLISLTPAVTHRLMVDGIALGYRSFEVTVSQYPTTPIPEGVEGKDMLYSSGTTGRPKGVINTVEDQPFGSLHPSVLAMVGICGFDETTRYLSPAPLYHAAPLRFCIWVLRMGGWWW